VGYLVETSGRVLLPQELERQALTVLEVRMGGLQGWFDADDVHVDTLEELAQFAATSVRRDGDWLVLSTDTDGDPKWSEQASEFYRSLGSFVREGEVHVRGEDGQAWSYLYSGGAVTQRGDNGWDGTPGSAPAAASPPGAAPAPPAPASQAPPSAPEPPGSSPVAPPPGGEDLGPAPSQFRYPGSEERPEPPPAPYGPGASAPTGPPPGPPLQQGPGVPDYRADRAWADPPPASTGRTLLMVTLLVVGVVLIIGLALLVSGL
jgi:hypothetical protein